MRMNFVIACLRPWQKVKLGIFTSSRAVDGKEMSNYCLFDFLVAAASRYLRYIVIRQNRVFSGKIEVLLLVASQTVIFSTYRQFLRFWLVDCSQSPIFSFV